MLHDHNFKFAEPVLLAVFKRHQDAKMRGADDYEAFKAFFTEYAKDTCHFIFNILPLCPKAHQAFYEGLDKDQRALLSGLVNLSQVPPEIVPFEIDAEAIPQVLLDVEEEDCFSIHGECVFGLGEQAALTFYEHIELHEIQAMTEEKQVEFINFFQQSGNHSLGQNEDLHKKLVFGLHIPEEVKDYHHECIRELTRRILTSPVYAGFFEAFMMEWEDPNSLFPMMSSKQDKKFMVDFFMGQMADIWNTPRPVEEDYEEEPEIDRAGNQFVSAMHAYYRFSPDGDDAKPLGLIFGVNCANGEYLDSHSIETLGTLAHEFAHLCIDFVHHQYNPYFDQDPDSNRYRESGILKLKNFDTVMSTNKGRSASGKYYGPIKTDFGDLTAPDGAHPYKGQINERHSDWLGAEIVKAISKTMRIKPALRNLDKAKKLFFRSYRNILSYNRDFEGAADLIQSFESDVEQTKTVDDLLGVVSNFCDQIIVWSKGCPELEEKQLVVLSAEDFGSDRKNARELLESDIAALRGLCDDFIDFQTLSENVFEARHPYPVSANRTVEIAL